METARDYVKEVFMQLEERFATAGTPGIAAGIPMIDLAGGMFPGELFVLAGNPGCGKTSMAISIAVKASAEKADVLYIALAERADQIAERALVIGTSVSGRSLRCALLSKENMHALVHSAAALSNAHLHIEDAIDATARGLRALVRGWRAGTTRKRALVVVDYVQLLNPEPQETSSTRDAEMSAALRTLQNSAKESNVSMLLVSQLNRRWAERLDQRPQLIDLRESGTLEAVATAVAFIHPPTEPDLLHEVILAKHRRFMTPCTDEFTFDGASGTFVVSAAH